MTPFKLFVPPTVLFCPRNSPNISPLDSKSSCQKNTSRAVGNNDLETFGTEENGWHSGGVFSASFYGVHHYGNNAC